MQQLLKWTLDTIREEESCFSWMEEYRYEWAPLVKGAVSQSIEGKTALIVTDESRRWFGSYVTQSINAISKNRPLLPFYELVECYPMLSTLKNTQDLELLEDMLDISYPNGYYFWYIGKGNHPFTKLVYRNNRSFLWILDEEIQDSFLMRSSDRLLDVKFLQLFNLFDQTLSAALFGDLDLES